MIYRIAILLAVSTLYAGTTAGATIRLKSESQPAGTIVYLGDVAEIDSADSREAEKLSRVELIPAPNGGESRYLRASQIQDLLNAHGFDLRTIRIGGAAQVKLTQANAAPKSIQKQASPYDQRRAERMAADAIRRHLAAVGQADATWTIEVQLAGTEAARLVRTAGSLTATGGSRPWTGNQDFRIQWQTDEGDEQLDVSAEITLPTSVVATIRDIPRGALIRAEDVALQAAPSNFDGRVVQTAFLSIDDVIGKEATRNIPAGQPLDDKSARSPILVKQNDVVTVYARAGGITVQTNARARQNGSQGELITVETFERKPFFARVSGHQEVEVLATPSTLR